MSINFNDLLSWADKACTEFSLIWRDEVQYNKNATDFEEGLHPFLVKEARVDHWPGTEIMSKNATIRIYRVCDGSLQILKLADSSFDFVGPNFPEDLAFYVNDKVVFASVAHEKLAWFEE